jgi:hypothetical protein
MGDSSTLSPSAQRCDGSPQQHVCISELVLSCRNRSFLRFSEALALALPIPDHEPSIANNSNTLPITGSLYMLALTQNPVFGPITPLGGTCFIVGWLTLFFSQL